jgi:hypothetical protein
MSATLNLGTDGQWATKENSLLGYNSENGNYKPLPFDFTRASSATVVNKSGLIETAANGVPRIDFLGNTSGALLLEPQRTNSLLQSNQFNTTWATSSGVTITSEQTISPQGINNGWKFEKTAAAYKSIGQSYTSSNETTFSIFAKKGTLSVITLFTNISGGTNLYQRFDLENGIVSTGAGMSSSNIKDYGNGWYRCSSTFTNASVTSLDFFAEFSENNAGYIYMYGAQAEVGSYSTSLINTQGSAVTRVSDSCLQVGFQDKNIFGTTQGSAVFELKWDIGGYVFDFSDALGIRLRIFDGGSDWKIRDYGGGSWVNTGFTKSNNVKTKIGFKWNGTEFTTFQDGVKSSITDSFASSMSIARITTNKLNNTSNMQFYNTALTDAELIALTQV